MAAGCQLQRHGSDEHPDRVIHGEDEMFLQILPIQQRPKFLTCYLSIPLFVEYEGDE